MAIIGVDQIGQAEEMNHLHKVTFIIRRLMVLIAVVWTMTFVMLNAEKTTLVTLFAEINA